MIAVLAPAPPAAPVAASISRIAARSATAGPARHPPERQRLGQAFYSRW
jgi:hypothetical protein